MSSCPVEHSKKLLDQVRDVIRLKHRVASLVGLYHLHRRSLRVKLLHAQDLAAGLRQVYLPYALDRKYPNASREWSKRQYVFPSDRLSNYPRSGGKRRHHVDESNLQRAVKTCPE